MAKNNGIVIKSNNKNKGLLNSRDNTIGKIHNNKIEKDISNPDTKKYTKVYLIFGLLSQSKNFFINFNI